MRFPRLPPHQRADFLPRRSTAPHIPRVKMADQIQELLEVPSEFTKDGIQFLRRCTKRKCPPYPPVLAHVGGCFCWALADIANAADKAEFLRLCQAVGVGFLVSCSTSYGRLSCDRGILTGDARSWVLWDTSSS